MQPRSFFLHVCNLDPRYRLRAHQHQDARKTIDRYSFLVQSSTYHSLSITTTIYKIKKPWNYKCLHEIYSASNLEYHPKFSPPPNPTRFLTRTCLTLSDSASTPLSDHRHTILAIYAGHHPTLSLQVSSCISRLKQNMAELTHWTAAAQEAPPLPTVPAAVLRTAPFVLEAPFARQHIQGALLPPSPLHVKGRHRRRRHVFARQRCANWEGVL